jgi:GDPmannose 4,6-dehydratase
MKKALICGVSGQDGAYLAELLLKQGYAVCGTSRDAQISPFQNLVHLGIKDQVKLESMSLNLLEAIRFLGATIKLYNAGSSECFGDTGNVAAAENTPFRPRSPYAVAKAAVFGK